MKVNKKGQEMSVATLILIVIGIVVLVMLILGFSMGWKNLWGKINVLGGGSNVESVIQACNIAATSDSAYSYCNEFKKVTIGSETRYYNCQAKEIEGNLDKRLSCTPDPLEAYCKGLAGTKTGEALEDVRKTKVNDKTCADFVASKADAAAPAATKCADVGVVTPANPGCPTGKAVIPNTDATGATVCCQK